MIAPEVLKLILEEPRAVDPVVAALQLVDGSRLPLTAGRGVAEENPPQALEGELLALPDLPPLILAHLVHRLVQGFDDVEAVDDQRRACEAAFDDAGVGSRHVAAGILDLLALILAEMILEEMLEGCAALTGADPNDLGAFQIIDDRRVFMPATVADLVDAEHCQSADLVTAADTGDDAV